MTDLPAWRAEGGGKEEGSGPSLAGTVISISCFQGWKPFDLIGRLMGSFLVHLFRLERVERGLGRGVGGRQGGSRTLATWNLLNFIIVDGGGRGGRGGSLIELKSTFLVHFMKV